MTDLLDKLATGERKQVALSGEVAVLVAATPKLLPDLISALSHENPVVASHAAHALFTLACQSKALLEPYASDLLAAYSIDQWEAKEQLAKILPALDLSSAQRRLLAHQLDVTLRSHKSTIARVCALQAIADLARQDKEYISLALTALDYADSQSSKALEARARKLSCIF